MNEPLKDPAGVYDLLLKACRALDRSGDHAIAAIISHGMAMMRANYEIEIDDAELSDEMGGPSGALQSTTKG